LHYTDCGALFVDLYRLSKHSNGEEIMRAIIIFVILVLINGAAYAQEEKIVMSAGVNSCGKWMELRDEQPNHYQYKQWVFGFISGSNWTSAYSQSSPIDGEAAVAFIDQYCKNNPLHALVIAAVALVQESGGPKALHEWKR
jgi:hypothetical protein